MAKYLNLRNKILITNKIVELQTIFVTLLFLSLKLKTNLEIMVSYLSY